MKRQELASTLHDVYTIIGAYTCAFLIWKLTMCHKFTLCVNALKYTGGLYVIKKLE